MASTAYKAFMSAAQALPGFNTSNKPYAQVSYADLSAQGMPLTQQQSYQPCQPNVTPRHEILFQRFRRIRRWTKIAVVFSHVFSGLFSVFMEAVMFYVTYTFYKTKDYPMPDRPWGPWPKSTKLWPTYMLAAASVVTTLLSLGMLIALCCRAKRKAAFFSILYMLVHVICWAIVAVLYRVGKTGDDLWGWSCNDKAKEIQKTLGSSVLNFQSLCKFQVSLPLTLNPHTL
jgi:small-conductance mechanosensitive channel